MDIYSDELGLSNYYVYRSERSSVTSIYTLGVGVLIGVRKNIQF